MDRDHGSRTDALRRATRALLDGEGRRVTPSLAASLDLSDQDEKFLYVLVAEDSPIRPRWEGPGRGGAWDRSWYGWTVNQIRRDGKDAWAKPITDRLHEGFCPIRGIPTGHGRYAIYLVVPASVVPRSPSEPPAERRGGTRPPVPVHVLVLRGPDQEQPDVLELLAEGRTWNWSGSGRQRHLSHARHGGEIRELAASPDMVLLEVIAEESTSWQVVEKMTGGLIRLAGSGLRSIVINLP